MSEVKDMLQDQMMFVSPLFVNYCEPNHRIVFDNNGESICPSCQRKRFAVVAEYERQVILQGIQEIENQSHKTRTPLFQDTLFEMIRKLINDKDN